MTLFIEKIKNWTSLLPVFSLGNAVEIIIIAVIVYEILNWIMSTRAFTLLKGILVILVFAILAVVFQLNTIIWIMERLSAVAVIVVVIVFQPELRRALEQLGSKDYLAGFGAGGANDISSMSNESAEMISKAVFQMAKVRTGALISIEQRESLKDYIDTGIMINGDISSGLLINIFEKNTPLHDGAVIIRGNKVVAATCYLPLSDNQNISKAYGTRHRAALGLSEVTDCVTIVVSEETGSVSFVQNGQIMRVREERELDELLFTGSGKEESGFFRHFKKDK